MVGMMRVARIFWLFVVGGVLVGPMRMRAQDAMHMGDVVVSFGPQVLSWQELRAEMAQASGGAGKDVAERVERARVKLKKGGHDRVPASPASLPEKTMAEMPSGKVRTIRRL